MKSAGTALPACTVLATALRYLALVFGAGFVLGAVRVSLVEPRLGMRSAELLEMPLMFGVIVLASGIIVRKARDELSPRAWFGVEVGALGLVLCAELLMAVVLAERTLGEYLTSRDPVSGTAYLLLLVIFALAPWWRRRTRDVTR